LGGGEVTTCLLSGGEEKKNKFWGGGKWTRERREWGWTPVETFFLIGKINK